MSFVSRTIILATFKVGNGRTLTYMKNLEGYFRQSHGTQVFPFQDRQDLGPVATISQDNNKLLRKSNEDILVQYASSSGTCILTEDLPKLGTRALQNGWELADNGNPLNL